MRARRRGTIRKGVSSGEPEPRVDLRYPRLERLIERQYNHRPTNYRVQTRSKDIMNPAMAILVWVEWRHEAEDFVAEEEVMPLVEVTLADDVTLPLSILRHTLHETRHHSHI